MRDNHKISRLVILTTLCSSVAFAMSLRQKQFAKQQDKYFQRPVKAVIKTCGANIDAKIEWQSFAKEIDKQLDGKMNRSFYGYCASPLGAMQTLCADADAKTAVQKQIKRYRCRFGGEGKRKVTLSAGTFTLWVDWEAKNYSAFVKDFLGRRL